jgi:uroporphyrinogen decarboxylase
MKPESVDSLLLDALHCCNLNRPPVWLMRQAGRYMPQYRALREKYSLWDMFHRPELAAQITMLPITLLDVDAAILFSDILVIAECLGLQIAFPDRGGPQVVPRIATKEQVAALPVLDVASTLSYVFETIAEVKKNLNVPLIGFCGGPFTVATYFIDSTSKEQFERTKSWMREDPKSLHLLLDKITTVSITYLKEQVQTGVQAVQIFDSWANILSTDDFSIWCMPYLRRMVDALRDLVPVILFCRDSSIRYAELAELRPACISLDGQRSMLDLRNAIPASIAVQGNIAPELLKGPAIEIQRHVEDLMRSMKGQQGFIVNLGHGVLPDIPFEHVKYFVQAVKEHN